MIYLKIFCTFFKIGLFTIGGGLAALPLLLQELTNRGWATEREFIDMVAVSQSTPGPIGINMATYVGTKLDPLGGGLAATAGMVAPSLIIIMLIATFMRNFAQNTRVQNALGGLRPAAAGLIGAAVWFILVRALADVGRFPEQGWLNLPAVGLFAALGLLRFKWNGYPVYFILIGAVAGVLLF